jgi:hypothetical protein
LNLEFPFYFLLSFWATKLLVVTPEGGGLFLFIRKYIIPKINPSLMNIDEKIDKIIEEIERGYNCHESLSGLTENIEVVHHISKDIPVCHKYPLKTNIVENDYNWELALSKNHFFKEGNRFAEMEYQKIINSLISKSENYLTLSELNKNNVEKCKARINLYKSKYNLILDSSLKLSYIDYMEDYTIKPHMSNYIGKMRSAYYLGSYENVNLYYAPFLSDRAIFYDHTRLHVKTTKFKPKCEYPHIKMEKYLEILPIQERSTLILKFN